MTSIQSTTHVARFDAKSAVLPGAIGGLLGGMALAMFSMIVATSRDGFWSPVRGITSVAFGDSHYGGGFDFWSVAVGAGGHMMNSVMLGIVFAVLAGLLLSRASAAVLAATGAVFGLMVWAVMVGGVAHGLQDSDLFANSIPQWAWAAGHMMFGAITGLAVSRASRSTGV